jgi:hypothetical protein
MLATCHGFSVTGADGELGHVETPLFADDSLVPDYLIVRLVEGSRRFVPVGVLAGIDLEERRVVLRLTRIEFEQLPERLPLGRSFRPADHSVVAASRRDPGFRRRPRRSA